MSERYTAGPLINDRDHDGVSWEQCPVQTDKKNPQPKAEYIEMTGWL